MVTITMTRSRFLPLLLVSGVSSLVLFGCTDHPSSGQQNGAYAPHQKSADDLREEQENTPPYVGMTKGEVLQRYGQPKTAIITDRGERWTYFLNEGEVVGKSFIPFYIPPRPRFAIIFFNQNGRIAEFHWDAVANR